MTKEIENKNIPYLIHKLKHRRIMNVTATSWSALLSQQLQIRLLSLTNYISQNSLPGLIITDHIHLYLIL